MNDFNQVYTENLPGVFKFWFAPTTFINSISEASDFLISSISWDSGKDWYQGWSLQGQLLTMEENEETEHGTLYNCSLKVIYPGDDSDIVSLFNEMRTYRFIVAFKDGNGQYKLLGSLDAPCKFTYKLSKSQEVNQYEFMFSCVAFDDLPFLDSSVVS